MSNGGIKYKGRGLNPSARYVLSIMFPFPYFLTVIGNNDIGPNTLITS